MKTRAVRLYGKNDLRLETFELPPIKDDEILASKEYHGNKELFLNGNNSVKKNR